MNLHHSLRIDPTYHYLQIFRVCICFCWIRHPLEKEIDILENESILSDSESKCEPCILGQTCPKKNSENEIEGKEFYKILSQFQELKINVLTHNNVIELFQIIKDPILRSKIIEQIKNTPSTYCNNREISYRISSPEGPYMMSGVYKRIRQKEIEENPTSTNDIIIEINNLKK